MGILDGLQGTEVDATCVMYISPKYKFFVYLFQPEN
jgi:hypothetical protein